MASLKTRTLRQRALSESGSELIEFGLVLPVLLFVIVGIFDFGFAFQQYEVVTNAAREGARVAVLPGYSDTVVQNRVASYITAGGLPGSATVSVSTVTIPTGAGGPVVTGRQVTVQYPHTFVYIGPIASFFGGSWGTITLTAVSTMRSEVAAAGS